MSTADFATLGAGLGLRREMLSDYELLVGAVDFLEVAPENWMRVGGPLGAQFRRFTQDIPFVCHGLSLSIGGPNPLDVSFVRDVAAFLKRHNVILYSEHLSYCSDDGHLYDLMPLPFTEEAVKYVATRVQQVQDILGQTLVLENVSYYAQVTPEMTELEFLLAVLDEAGCDLLLDVNNVYVNSVNHGYDPKAFIAHMPTERIRYLHIAGHYDEAPDLLVDTHGSPVKEDVWSLLDWTYEQHGVIPTLLERDFNLPTTQTLIEEMQKIREIQAKHGVTTGCVESNYGSA
ncbi:MAG: DUF692 domain-containing protein [Gammaproteobacteria bacterium]|nr:MAG: DUF692 domain-containing protein [Gammaproteobacteria bacterium]